MVSENKLDVSISIPSKMGLIQNQKHITYKNIE